MPLAQSDAATHVLAPTSLMRLLAPTTTAPPSQANDDDDDTNEDSASAGAGGNATATAGSPRGGVLPLVRPLLDGAVELRSFRTGRAANFCFQAPVVVTKSARVAANAVCPAKWAKLSCSCVSMQSANAHWDVRVSKRSASSVVAAPVPATANGTIAVTSIGIFILPNNVASLRLVGDSPSKPLSVELRLMYETNKERARAPQLVMTTNNSALSTVEVANIDLAAVEITADFVPAHVSSISFQQCNVETLASSFFTNRQSSLKTLNLSGNRLTAFASAPLDGKTSVLTALDLSNNSLTSFPVSLASLTNLKTLNVRGNPLANFSVSSSQFAHLARLPTLLIDPAARGARECPNGALQRIGSVSFCVLGDDSASSSTQGNAGASSRSNTVLYVGIAIPVAVLLIGLAAFAVFRRRRRSADRDAKASSFDISLLERTQSPHSAALPVADALLQDPVIAMHRIPFAAVRVGACVKEGGFGVVYRGVYKRRPVAIKRIRAGQHRDVLRIEAFVREICLMASLEHPRIVRFVGVAWEAHSLANLSAVTEFMEKGDLRDVLQSHKQRGQPLSWRARKLRIALHIAEALAYLHALVPTVIHRDLKSKNVLLNADLDAKLSDFGISREWTVDDTHMTVGIGTSFWIAPEVLLGKKYDERADVFSFGVVLSELDTDDYPYWNAVNGTVDLNENAILRLVAVGQVRPTFTPNCPRAILELADLCLQGNPQHRPTSAQIVNVLRHLLAHGGDSSYPSSSSSMSITGSVSNDSFY